MKITDYCLSEDVTVPKTSSIWSDPITLHAGTFVKMIDFRWVPKHIIDAEVNKFYDEDKEVFCYCSAGIILIPKKSIREI